MKMKENTILTPLLGHEEDGILDSIKFTEKTRKKKMLTTLEESSKSRMERNIYAISISFCFLFACLSSLNAVQSSINKLLGNIGLSSIYVSLVVSCTFFSTWVIKKFKVKKAMTMCMLGYLPYFAVQVQPSIYTLVPAAFAMGLAAAPLWTSQCTYFTLVANSLAGLTGEDSDVILTRYFGIFFFFFRSTEAIGNLVTSSVFSQGAESKVSPSESALLHCGYNFCPATFSNEGNATNTNLERPPDSQIFTVVIISLTSGLLSAIIMWSTVDSAEKYGEDQTNSGEMRIGEMFMNTFRHMRHPYQALIIPLTIWMGIELGFFGGDFTLAFVTCSVGVHMVGYTSICFGVADAIGSSTMSKLVGLIGRLRVVLLGCLANVVVIVSLMWWMPRPEEYLTAFCLAALWGFADAVWQTQINSLYGLIFPGDSEIAFNNFRLWESLGFFIAYACGGTFCMSTKIGILIFFLALGMLGYLAIEFMERNGGPIRDKRGNVIPIDQLILGKRGWGFCKTFTSKLYRHPFSAGLFLIALILICYHVIER